MTPHHRLAWLALVFLFALPASAQDRAGRGLWLRGEIPGVWINPRQMWVPATGEEILSVCGPRGGCAPVVSQDACTVPVCPGDGTLLSVDRSVAQVGQFPQDYGGYRRELEALRATASLGPIFGSLREHPDHGRHEEARMRREEAESRERARRQESVRWVSQYRENERLELSLSATVATMLETDAAFAGATATASFIYLSDDDDADDHRSSSSFFNIMVGDQMGAELRVHFLYRVDGGAEAEWATLVGLAPAFANRFQRTVVRLPSAVGALLPEIGVALRADRDATWYVAWSFPVSLLVAHELAIDLAARAFIVDAWGPEQIEEDGTSSEGMEAILMFSFGARLP